MEKNRYGQGAALTEPHSCTDPGSLQGLCKAVSFSEAEHFLWQTQIAFGSHNTFSTICFQMVSRCSLLEMSHVSFQSSVSCSLLRHFFFLRFISGSLLPRAICAPLKEGQGMPQMHLLRDHSKALAASHMGINLLNLQTAENNMKIYSSERPDQPHLPESILYPFFIYNLQR